MALTSSSVLHNHTSAPEPGSCLVQTHKKKKKSQQGAFYLGLSKRQVVLAVSDACGRNAGRGRQQARAALQHSLAWVTARQYTKRTKTQKPRLWFGLSRWDCLWHWALTKYSDSSFFSLLLLVFYHRWLWTAAGVRGDRGSIAPERVGGEWSSPTGSATILYHRMEGNTVRARGWSISPVTLHRVMIMVRISTYRWWRSRAMISNLKKRKENYTWFPIPERKCQSV